MHGATIKIYIVYLIFINEFICVLMLFFVCNVRFRNYMLVGIAVRIASVRFYSHDQGILLHKWLAPSVG